MEHFNCPNCGCQLQQQEPVIYGNAAIDGRGSIFLDGSPLEFRRSQYEIVQALIRAKGRALTMGCLAALVGDEIEDVTIRQYVKRARATFCQLDADFDQIKSVHGFGAYRWSRRA